MIAPREAVRNAMTRLMYGHVEAARAAARESMLAAENAMATARCPSCGERPSRFSARNSAATCRAGHAWQPTGGAAPKPPAPAPWYPPFPAGPGPAPKPAAAAKIVNGAGLLYVERAIGRGAGEIGADAVVAQLADLETSGARAVLVTLDSPGGDAVAGLAIHDALRSFSGRVGPVVAHVLNAGSIASVIALAADFLVIDAEGSIFIHGPSGEDPDLCDAVRGRMREVYLARSGLSDGDVGWAFADWTRLDASAAYRDRLADEIGNRDRAIQIAEAAAGGGLPFSRRGRMGPSVA